MGRLLNFDKINSIRYRILFGFLIITAIYLLYLLISFNYVSRLDAIRQTDKKIAQLEAKTLMMIKKDNDFFDLESINPRFFETKESLILSEREQLNQQINHEIKQLLESTDKDGRHLKPLVEKASISLKEYNEHFDQLKEYIYIRGFKDYGLEGEMRTYAHQLEQYFVPQYLKPVEILTLRRHEKDFFLRNEKIYIENFNNLANDVKQKLPAGSNALQLLNNYQNIFNELAQLQFEIGLSSREGLRRELNSLTDELTLDFEDLLASSEGFLAKRASEVKLSLLLIYLLAAALSILISINAAMKLSRPIRKLSRVMSEVVRQRFNKKPEYNLINPTVEIKQLSSSFDELMKEMELRMKDIREKSSILKSQNKDLIKLNHELDNFLYSTAHDLRSPLTSLLGLINLSHYENKDPNMNTYFSMMKDSVHKMESFIADVVNYAKNNKIEREIEKIDIEDLINQLIVYNKNITSKEYDFHIKIEGEYPVYSDVNRLKIIFNNLISNAVKYQDITKPNPYATIEVKVERECIRIQCSDNGIGIAEEHQKRIFDMFYRATELSKGSGLGLYLLREAARKLNGNVEIDSTIGKGSSFLITLENFIPGKEHQHSIAFADNLLKAGNN